MKTKNNYQLWIAMALLCLILVACQPSAEEIDFQETAEIETDYPAEDTLPQNTAILDLEDAPIQETAVGEIAYPAESAQVQQTPGLEAAYPITEEDLQLLLKTWDLSVYSKDGIVQEPMVKTLRFGADGSYEMITESGTTTGNWTARLFAIESTLILTDSSGETLTFEIVDLEEALLNLRSWRENGQIEEQFSPAE